MSDFLSPSVKVREVRKGSVVLQGVPSVSTGAFQGVTQKGPVATPQKVSSFPDAQAVYGTYLSTSHLMRSVQAFFDNGGQYCYISRAAHYTTISDPTTYDMVAAQVQLQDGAPANSILVKASSPGTWGNGYKVSVTRTSQFITTIATTIPAGATTQATLTSVSRIAIGDLLLITGANAVAITVTVTSIDATNNKITFASVTTGAGGATAGATSSVASLTFTMQALNASGLIDQQWSNLRMSPASANYFVTIVNGAFRTPFVLTDSGSSTADSRPATQAGTALASGTDGSTVVAADYIGNSAGTGVYAWNQVSDLGMLSIPGITDATVNAALIDYAEFRQLFLAICDVPQGSAPAAAVTYVQTTVNHYSSYAAYLYPWVKIVSPLDGTKVSAPPCGFWQGIIARTDRTRGPWKAPAGIEDGQVRGIVGVDYNVQQPDYDLLYPAKINAIQTFVGAGTAVMGNTTLDISGEFIEVGVRRLFLYVERSLAVGLRWVNFEPNSVVTRARVQRNVRGFLKTIWDKGGLAVATPGAKFDDAHFVICDETNNDAVVQAARKLNCRVGLAPVHAAEFVDVSVEQDTRALEAAIASST